MRGQTATEYFAMLAVVLIIVAVGAYYINTRGPNFPALSVGVSTNDNEIWITIDAGSIAAGDWEYSVSTEMGQFNWQTGSVELSPPGISVGQYSPGIYYVSLKHSSGHIYISKRTVQIT